jgi:hypothetical protein
MYIIFSLKNFFVLKFCGKILFCKHYFSPLNTFMRKGKDPDPYLCLIDPEPDPGGQKTCESGSGIPNTGYRPINYTEPFILRLSLYGTFLSISRQDLFDVIKIAQLRQF